MSHSRFGAVVVAFLLVVSSLGGFVGVVQAQEGSGDDLICETDADKARLEAELDALEQQYWAIHAEKEAEIDRSRAEKDRISSEREAAYAALGEIETTEDAAEWRRIGHMYNQQWFEENRRFLDTRRELSTQQSDIRDRQRDVRAAINACGTVAEGESPDQPVLLPVLLDDESVSDGGTSTGGTETAGVMSIEQIVAGLLDHWAESGTGYAELISDPGKFISELGELLGSLSGEDAIALLTELVKGLPGVEAALVFGELWRAFTAGDGYAFGQALGSLSEEAVVGILIVTGVGAVALAGKVTKRSLRVAELVRRAKRMAKFGKKQPGEFHIPEQKNNPFHPDYKRNQPDVGGKAEPGIDKERDLIDRNRHKGKDDRDWWEFDTDHDK